MVGQNGIKLALNIISTHFGNLVTKVCECLLRKGSLTLAEIIRFTQLTPSEVKNCILVLIQHNCVQAFSFFNEDDQGGIPKGTHYTVIFDNILHRLRFPKFLNIVSQQLDTECEELLESLLLHGRLTLAQNILRIISNRKKVQENYVGDCAVQDALRESFMKLVSAHYVERCPDSESIPKPDERQKPSARRRGAKSAKFVEPVTVEQQAVTAAVPLQRFSIETNTGIDLNSEANASGKSPDPTVGEKRKVEDVEMDDGTDARICEQEVLWRANFEEFICHLRHKACVASVRSRHDDGAVIVLNAVLELIRKAQQKVKIESSVPLSRDAIYAEVIKVEEGRSMTAHQVEEVLAALDCPCCTVETEVSYSVDLKNIIEIAQNDEVESLVSARYGKDAFTMFRFLSKAAKLKETDEISDTAFVEKAEARKILYTLWKDEFLHMEKVISHVSAQSQFLLWKINQRSVREHVFDEMCHAALNLRLRLAYELEQEREILQLEKDELWKLKGAQRKKLERIKKVNILLNSSLMKLDDALMLFHDF